MGLAYPGHDREQSYLFEHGQFGEEEREELIEDWRREFEKTLSPDFAYCVGQRPDGQGAKWLHGQAARKAHYRWADISASLVEQWTRERRHPSPPPDRDRGEPRGSSPGSLEAVARLQFPQNVACGFPALRSSAGVSQHCKSLQLRIWEAQLWFQ